MRLVGEPLVSLEPEVRCGHEVSAEMKKVWAIELDMLSELLRVCERHELRVYADCGTLLGAVRHGGFIPWDDDIDVVMPREDYDKLVSVASDEFAEPLFFQCVYSEPNYSHRHAQLRNSESAAWREVQPWTDINSGVFIDIFPLDYLPSTPYYIGKHLAKLKRLKQRLKLTQRLLKKVPLLYRYCRENVACLSDKVIMGMYEDVARSVGESGSVFCCPLAVRYKEPIRDVACYEETLWMDFEGVKMPVPVGYERILKAKYGDYMVHVKDASYHGRYRFDPDRSYKDVIEVK